VSPLVGLNMVIFISECSGNTLKINTSYTDIQIFVIIHLLKQFARIDQKKTLVSSISSLEVSCMSKSSFGTPNAASCLKKLPGTVVCCGNWK